MITKNPNIFISIFKDILENKQHQRLESMADIAFIVQFLETYQAKPSQAIPRKVTGNSAGVGERERGGGISKA